MSTGPNHRRGHGRIQERGPRYENADPGSGCNSTHVARARTKWAKRRVRANRRSGGEGGFRGGRPFAHRAPEHSDEP
jgi:hypothetical protein